MNVLFIFILNIISINFSLSQTPPLYRLIKLLDYYNSSSSYCVLRFNYSTNNNITLINYNYTKNLTACKKAGLCEEYKSLNPYSEKRFDSSINYLVFERQDAYVRLFIENYEYNTSLNIESSLCFDFFNAHNNLKIVLLNSNNFNTSLNIQYCSSSNSGQGITNVTLYEEKERNKYLINKYANSLNITQVIKPNTSIVFEFSPPKTHSMYCLYYSYYDNFYINVDDRNKTVPIISPQIYHFFSVFEEKKINLTSFVYGITYHLKIKNATIKDCHGYQVKNQFPSTQEYSCSSIVKIDDENYKISYQINKSFTHSYLTLYLEPNNFNDDSFLGNYIEFYRTVEDPEYLIDIFKDLKLGIFLSILGLIMIFALILTGERN